MLLLAGLLAVVWAYARVHAQAGELIACVALTDALMAGVVSLPSIRGAARAERRACSAAGQSFAGHVSRSIRLGVNMTCTSRRAIVFDYDDTLVQTRTCKYRAIIALAERYYGFAMSSASIDKHWGIPYTALFEQLFGQLDSDVQRVIQRYEAMNEEFPVLPYPDTLDAIERLLQRDVTVGVVTSAGEIVKRQMLSVGIPLERLAFVQTAVDTDFHKPDPRVFAPALQKLSARGLSPSSTTYIGDSLSDFRAAQGAGLSFVGIYDRTTPHVEFQRVGARAVSGLRELVHESLEF